MIDNACLYVTDRQVADTPDQSVAELETFVDRLMREAGQRGLIDDDLESLPEH